MEILIYPQPSQIEDEKANYESERGREGLEGCIKRFLAIAILFFKPEKT